MKSINLLIKPASSLCNMRCEYCFYQDVAVNRDMACYGMMAENTLEAIVKNAFSFVEESCCFAFQGGEPTIRGLDFYEKLILLQQKYNINGCKVTNCIQTNGYIIDEKWATFFKKHHFLVGISLDGDMDMHNTFRKDAAGKGTFNHVMKSINLFKKYDVEFNILSVITRQSARHVERLFAFYNANKFNFIQLIPCIEPLQDSPGKSKDTMTADRYGAFLCRAFDYWYRGIIENHYISIRYFDNIWNILQGMQPEMCSMYGRCVPQFVIEADGGVYPCDFYVLDEWKLGNVLQNDFDQLLKSHMWDLFMRRSVELPTQCKQCQYFSLCRNGCYRDRVPRGEEMQNYYCGAYQTFFSYSLPKFQHLAEIITQKYKV